MKNYFKFTILVLIMFIAVGCAIQKAEPVVIEEPQVEETNTDIIEEEPIEEEKVYEHTALLTGIPAEFENTKRPIAVLINNLKPARPQSGLHEADIIWEVLAEGG